MPFCTPTASCGGWVVAQRHARGVCLGGALYRRIDGGDGGGAAGARATPAYDAAVWACAGLVDAAWCRQHKAGRSDDIQGLNWKFRRFLAPNGATGDC